MKPRKAFLCKNETSYQKNKKPSQLLTAFCFVLIFSIFSQLTIGSISNPQKTKASEPQDATASFWPQGPQISAPAAIVMEANSGVVLYGKDIYTAYYPASITKVMTSLLAFENSNPNDIMTMTVDAEMKVYGSRVGLVREESVTMESALYAVLLESANEVTYGVAEHVGGTMPAFVEMMNEKAKELGCVNTHFVNPHGLHEEGHYVCAYDMALIGQAAIAIPEFRKIAGTRTYTIPPTNKNVARPMAHHHLMIRKTKPYAYAIAGKTGGTNEAKNTLITFAQKDGLLLICVVLFVDTVDLMYEDTAKLFDYCFENFTAYSIQENELGGKATFSSLFANTTPFSVTEHEPILRFDTDSLIVLPNGVSFSQAQKSVELMELKEFVHGDNAIGTMQYTYGGVKVGQADITYYNEAYPINQAYLATHWPSFLVPIEEANKAEYKEKLRNALPTIPTTPPSFDESVEEENTKTMKTDKPWIFIGAGALILLLIIAYLCTYERAYQKAKRRWM